MTRIKMGSVREVPPGRVLEKRILARRILVINDGGRLYAIEGDCKHMKASLATGRVKDGTVTCPMHGWVYDLDTGECLTDRQFRLRTFVIEIEDTAIYITI